MPFLDSFSKVEFRILLLGSFEFFLLPVQRPLINTSLSLSKMRDIQKVLNNVDDLFTDVSPPDTAFLSHERWPLSVSTGPGAAVAHLYYQTCLSLQFHATATHFQERKKE